MDKSIIKIIIAVMIVYIILLVGGACLLMQGGKMMIDSMENPDQINQYKENRDRNKNGKVNPFSLSPTN